MSDFMGGFVEHWATGKLILFAVGFAALCVVMWFLGRRSGQAQAIANTRVELDLTGPAALRNGVEPLRAQDIVSGEVSIAARAALSESVALFRLYPAEIEVCRTANVLAPVMDRIEREIVVIPVIGAETARMITADTEPAALPVRRRPRPAWELAVDGQTPSSLLARAHEQLAAGNRDEALLQLRACARLASKLKDSAVEAVARLELGDLARSLGDMTTACEHWQLARSLYAELKRADEATAAAKRMEQAGCPTDWVLTKF